MKLDKRKIRLRPAEEIQVLRRITQVTTCSLNLEEVLKQIIEIVSQVTKSPACSLFLLDNQKRELILRASKNPHPKILGKIRLKLGEGITGWVAKKRKPVAISKNASDDPRFKFFHNLPEDKYQAFLSVPIISRDEVVGVINVHHKRVHQHTPNEIGLLSIIAQQVGGAIENARLYENMKKKALQLETLAQVSKTITSNRYLKEILQLIVTVTAEMMNSKICSIMFLDEQKRELTIEATQSLSGEYIKKPPLKVGESISGRVVEEKKPITVLDVTVEPRYKYGQIAAKEGLRSMLSVPMMIRDRIIGVINSYTTVEHNFTEDEIAVLQSVANQAAVTVENTKLMEETLSAREALEARKLVERAKGILMKDLGMVEEQAYKSLHRQSMDTRKPMKEIAEAIILTSEIKRKNI